MKKIILILLLITISLGFSTEIKEKFNDTVIQELKQTQYPNCVIYVDSSQKLQVYKLKVSTSAMGLLIPENGTILQDYILLPIDKKKISIMTTQDIDDIITFINSIDLQNRKFKK